MKLFIKIKYTNTPFILISTGSSCQKINDICSNLNFLQYIIIFCFNKQKYKNYIYNSNGKVKLISDNIEEINNFLNSIDFPPYNKYINEQID